MLQTGYKTASKPHGSQKLRITGVCFLPQFSEDMNILCNLPYTCATLVYVMISQLFSSPSAGRANRRAVEHHTVIGIKHSEGPSSHHQAAGVGSRVLGAGLVDAVGANWPCSHPQQLFERAVAATGGHVMVLGSSMPEVAKLPL